MASKGVGTRGNPCSPNISPRSDPERIIWEASSQQKEASSSTVEEGRSVKEMELIDPKTILEWARSLIE